MPYEIAHNEDMSNDQFMKLYSYMEKRFDQLERKLDSKAEGRSVERVLNAVDGIAARLDEDEQERTAIAAQVDRHDRWIRELAEGSNTELATS